MDERTIGVALVCRAGACDRATLREHVRLNFALLADGAEPFQPAPDGVSQVLYPARVSRLLGREIRQGLTTTMVDRLRRLTRALSSLEDMASRRLTTVPSEYSS